MIVFTNGCFDIIHPGHIDLLERAKGLGTKLIVGVNSDASVRAIKGPGRPIQDQESRRAVLLGLRAVDEVVIFDELTPEKIIRHIRPDVLVKGGDWQINEIIGADVVQSYGGKVFSLPLKEGFSSSNIVELIKNERPPSPTAENPALSMSSRSGRSRICSAASRNSPNASRTMRR